MPLLQWKDLSSPVKFEETLAGGGSKTPTLTLQVVLMAVCPFFESLFFFKVKLEEKLAGGGSKAPTLTLHRWI